MIRVVLHNNLIPFGSPASTAFRSASRPTAVALTHTYEDSYVKLVILKVLYVLFSSKLTAKHFYANDLCVLVDVFLWELADLDEENKLVSILRGDCTNCTY